MFSEIEPALKARAMRPVLEFGRGILGRRSRGWDGCLVVTVPEAWRNAERMLNCRPRHVHFVTGIERGVVEKAADALPSAETIIGVGGGTALDMAKYIAWKRGQEPVLIPSIASVDACVTNAVAVREEGKVNYVGFVVPQAVIADFTLMQTAPLHLNRAGIGDILSIHTGVWDWKLAAERGQAVFDEEVADQARRLVDELEDLGGELRDATDRGLRWLIEAYARENALCLKAGHSRPEEGSEHFFAYNAEHRTRRGFIHGELVCLGILLMSRLQDNQVGRVQKILHSVGVRHQPFELGLGFTELMMILCTLRPYVESEGLFYSIINEVDLPPAFAGRLCQDLQC